MVSLEWAFPNLHHKCANVRISLVVLFSRNIFGVINSQKSVKARPWKLESCRRKQNNQDKYISFNAISIPNNQCVRSNHWLSKGHWYFQISIFKCLYLPESLCMKESDNSLKCSRRGRLLCPCVLLACVSVCLWSCKSLKTSCRNQCYWNKEI